jgi:GNAT superfamily N-acetyltransferase
VVSSADNITVELVPGATDDVRTLIAELDRTLSAEYPPEQRHGLALDAIFKPNIRFFLAQLNGVAVGCGGVALFADFAKVKRMYVRGIARRRGVAQALLARIERGARRSCFAPARDGSASDTGAPLLSAGWVSTLRGIRRLRHDGTAGRRHQCLPPKATQSARYVIPDYLPPPTQEALLPE